MQQMHQNFGRDSCAVNCRMDPWGIRNVSKRVFTPRVETLSPNLSMTNSMSISFAHALVAYARPLVLPLDFMTSREDFLERA